MRAALACTMVAIVAACSLAESFDDETSRQCGPGRKACGDHCVGLTDPSTGCGGDSCAPCALANTKEAICDRGACAVRLCTEGYGDCDKIASNGCEVNTNSDRYNCSSCGRVCLRAHATNACVDGHCVVRECDPAYANCNESDPDGCEASLSSDKANCGECSRVCATGSCAGGRCLAVTSIVASASGAHACAILSDGTARCWGKNDLGQLGSESDASSGAVEIKSLTGVATMATGGAHTCAATSTGALWCWGSNEFGQLGIGQADVSKHSAPTRVSSLPDIDRIVAGAHHTCARQRTDQSVWCWGDGHLGQTAAPGAPLVVPSPMRVTLPDADGGVIPLSSVVWLAAGTDFTCAVRSDGKVFCWGDNASGQLGSGATGGTALPTPMMTIDDGEAVSGGEKVACVLRRRDASVWCAGDGQDGKLGNGTSASSNVPVPAQGSLAFEAVEVGGAHACAIQKSTSSLWCWGTNGRGQLFVSSATAPSYASPTPITSVDVAQVVAGRDFTCVMGKGAVVSCVGDNTFGQLGRSSDSLPHSSLSPVNNLP